MTLSELLPSIQELPRLDKFRLLRILADDVVRSEIANSEVPETVVPIWSTFDSFQGAAELLKALDDDRVAHAP